jgi:tetratricopeptide (TPR) repeat protein
VQLGKAAPLPFVGRADELAALCEALNGADRTVLVVRGPAGSGKSRLAQHLAGSAELVGDRAATMVACEPGDHAVAVLARAERLMAVLPGDAAVALQREPRLLIIDDLHHLAESEARHLLQALVAGPRRAHSPGRVLLMSRDMPPLRRDLRPFVLDLAGLDAEAARELWDHLEITHGPTRQGACDSAMARTQCLPLALRRAYAEAAHGDDAWELAALPPRLQRTLEALAVLALPAGPAACAALVAETAIEQDLAALVARQLVDPLDDGRFQVHALLRNDVLATMDAPRRRRWQREAAAWLAEGAATYTGLGHSALGLMDPADRMRAEVRYWLAAGAVAQAVRCLSTRGPGVLARGGDGEVAGLVALVQDHVAGAGQLAGDGPVNDHAEDHAGDHLDDHLDDHLIGRVVEDAREGTGARLAGLQLSIAVRRGEVARAIALDGDEAGPDRATSAMLRYRAGRVTQACRRLEAELQAPESTPDQRCRAAAHLAAIELALGRRERAAQVATTAFTSEYAEAGNDARALLHLSLAAVETHAGHLDAARAALARASSADSLEPELAARVDARLAVCLAQQGRLRNAEEALDRALRAARSAGAIGAADEIHLCQSQVALRRGDAGRAAEELRTLAQGLRRRGDEIGATSAEIDLAWALIRQGEISAAAEVVAGTRSTIDRAGLGGLRSRAMLTEAAIDAAELRHEAARAAAEALLVEAGVDAETRHEAALLLARVAAATGNDGVEPALARAAMVAEELRDDVAMDAIRAEAALGRGAVAEALVTARGVAVRAERAGRRAELAASLALCARLAMRTGDYASAAAAAARAEREARACQLRHSHALALLALAGLARGEGRLEDAVARARAAAEEAGQAGLGLVYLVALEALLALQPGGVGDSAGEREAMAAAAATLPATARDAAARLAADFGLSAECPYRLIGASGAETRLADASPERLRLGERGLAVDRVREVVLRNGTQIASLRRRSLLKRLLYLFAGAPGHTFSKEEIVERVWQVEYHPLRHDAALFTNIMRMRRLLGEDGADIIRVSDDGYRFVPPDDFVFIAPAGEQAA